MSSLVLVTGVFDVFHKEHEIFLRKAKLLGDRLVVGVESDARVRRLKGVGRPVNCAGKRMQTILDLKIADEVFVLPEKFDDPEDHRRLLNKIKPSILAISSHTPHQQEKLQLMQEIGGKVVVVHEQNPNVSSTILIENNQV